MSTIKTMTPDMIEARLAYQKPTPEQVAKMQELNVKVIDLGRAIGELPEGIMKSKAVTDLVLLRMVINAAVVGDGIPAGSLSNARPPQPSPEHQWDDLAKRWYLPGANGLAISHSSVGA